MLQMPMREPKREPMRDPMLKLVLKPMPVPTPTFMPEPVRVGAPSQAESWAVSPPPPIVTEY